MYVKVSWRQSTTANLYGQPGGKNMAVTSSNVEDYISDVLDAVLGKGAEVQVRAFREGFSKVFPVNDLKTFTADELVMLFGNSDEDWSTESRSLLSRYTVLLKADFISTIRSLESGPRLQCGKSSYPGSHRNHVRLR